MVLAACAAPAPAPAPAPKPTPTPAPAPKESQLQKIIEAAKKEGQVNWLTTTGHTPEETAKLIKDRFGVDLKINIGTGGQQESIAAAVMEIKSGMPPSFDVMHMSLGNYLRTGKANDIVAHVDWPALIKECPDISLADRYIPPPADFFYSWGYVTCNLYNKEKTSLADQPKNRLEYADPKYKGKFGWGYEATAFAELKVPYKWTNEQTIEFAKKLVANQPVLGRFQVQDQKLKTGEILMSIGSSKYYTDGVKTGAPYAWSPLTDFVQVNEYMDMPLRTAKNSNAALLLALAMGTPEGIKLSEKYGFFLDTTQGSVEYEMVQQAKKNGVPIFRISRNDMGYIDYYNSKEWLDLAKQLELIFQGGAAPATGGRSK